MTVTPAARILLRVAACCLVLQTVSASLQTRDLRTFSTSVAEQFVRSGELGWGPLRAYVLPGEALYLAAGFQVLPASMWRYLHVPVVVLLVTSVAAAALVIGGPTFGLWTGIVASLDPFVLWHGPVWDEAFLDAALDWCLFALLAGMLAHSASRLGARALDRRLLVLLAALAGLAAVTRTQSQLVLVALAAAVTVVPRFRPLRPAGLAMLAGLVLSLGAWGARNAVVLGSFHVGSTHDGKTLFESNCAYTRDGIRRLGVVGGFMQHCSPEQVERARGLGELEGDTQLRRDALAYMAANPGDVATTGLFKLMISTTGFDFRSAPLGWRNLGAAVSSAVTLTLGVAGLWRLVRHARRSPPVDLFVCAGLLTAAVTLMMLIVGPTGLRYRMTLTGFLYVGAGALLGARRLIAEPRRRSVQGGRLDALGG